MSKRWRTIVQPKTRLLDIPLREVWQYRSMIIMLVKRNYQIQYKQTILGPAWIIINPILSSGLFSLVFGYVGKFSSDGIPYFLFYMTASIIWTLFASSFTENSGVFINNAYLFGKVYFPRLVVPLSNGLFQLLRFGIQFAVCVIVWLIYFVLGKVAFMGFYLLLMPFLLILAVVLGVSLGMIVSSLTTKYRDLVHLVNFGVQLLMYAAPVLYPISQLPVFLQKIVMLNPMSGVIEAFRFCMTGSGTIHWLVLIYDLAMTVGISMISLALFNQTEKTFIDIV